MSPDSSPPPTLSAAQLERLATIVARFEHDWQQGNRRPLDDYLPDEPVLRDAVLRELVRAELEFRLEAGEPARVETYLERYPELAGQTTFLVNLVARECRLRQRREPGVCAADYLQRFPRHREQLEARLLLGVHPPQSSRTPPAQPAALESILRRFETAWDHGLRPDIESTTPWPGWAAATGRRSWRS